MRKRFVVAMLAVCFCLAGWISGDAQAVSPHVVISHIQLGSAVSASHEFIELYNNSSEDVEVTNWCLYYASAATTHNGTKLGCFVPPHDNVHLYVPGHATLLAGSSAWLTSQVGLGE